MWAAKLDSIVSIAPVSKRMVPTARSSTVYVLWSHGPHGTVTWQGLLPTKQNVAPVAVIGLGAPMR
jgi:hypothetical protein